MRQIALNAGVEGATVMRRVKAASDMIGYDAAVDAYVDLMDAGVLDPTKVSRTALQHAASVVRLLLTTEVLIASALEALMAHHDGIGYHRGAWEGRVGPKESGWLQRLFAGLMASNYAQVLR